MKRSLIELRGMTTAIKKALRTQGITDTGQLLAATRTAAQRGNLARLCHCRPETILAIAHRAEMTRLKGIGGIYSDLLEMAGVTTLIELEYADPHDLHGALVEINELHRYARQVPTLAMVTRWIEQARELAPVIEH